MRAEGDGIEGSAGQQSFQGDSLPLYDRRKAQICVKDAAKHPIHDHNISSDEDDKDMMQLRADESIEAPVMSALAQSHKAQKDCRESCKLLPQNFLKDSSKHDATLMSPER